MAAEKERTQRQRKCRGMASTPHASGQSTERKQKQISPTTIPPRYKHAQQKPYKPRVYPAVRKTLKRLAKKKTSDTHFAVRPSTFLDYGPDW